MTGTPGDSAAGLAILQNRLQVADAKDADYLIVISVHRRVFYRAGTADWQIQLSISLTV